MTRIMFVRSEKQHLPINPIEVIPAVEELHLFEGVFTVEVVVHRRVHGEECVESRGPRFLGPDDQEVR